MAESGNINSLNIKLTADPEGLKKGLDTAVKALQTGGDKMKQQSEKLAGAMNTWRKSVDDAGVAAVRKQRALFNLAAAYEDMGEKGAASLRSTLREAGAMKDRIDDLRLAVEAGHMEGKIKVFGQAIQSTIGIIAGAEGAMHMLGVKTDDAQKVTAKLQSLFAMGNAIGSVIALRDQMQALALTSGAVNTAMKVFQTLMRPGPLLLVGAAVTAISLAFQQVPKPAKAVSTELRTVTNLQESLAEAAQKTEGKYRMLTGILTNSNATLEMKRAALGQLQQMMPQYFKNLDVEKSSHEAVRIAIEAGAKALRDKAMAQAVEQRMTDLASKEIAKQLELQKEQQNLQKFDKRKGEVEWQKQKGKVGALGFEIMAIKNEREELVKIAASVGADFTKALEAGMEKGGTGNKAETKVKVKPKLEVQDKDMLDAMSDLNYQLAKMAPGAQGKSNKPAVSIPIELKFDQALAGKTGQRVQAQMEAMNSGLQSAMAGTVDNISNLIVDMFASPEDAMRNFGNAMLATLGQFMSTLGKAIIAAGTASQVFQKALLTNPAAAIAAGAALAVAGAAVTGIMKKGMNARNNPPAPAGDPDKPAIRPFATGGIVSGPTLGLMGEYAGARSNPEVVAPLDKLKSMLGGTGTLTTRVSGTDLLIMLDRAERNRGRVR